LLLDTGDALAGGKRLGDATQGEVIVAAMNLMGYDAMALGPLDLALGWDVLQQRVAEASFPLLSANTALTGTEELLVEPYAILEVGGLRVGVVGLTRPPNPPQPAFHILDPRQAAEIFVPQVAEQADTVILLTNMGYRGAMALGQAVPGIDLVVAALPNQLPQQAVRSANGTLVVTAEQPLPRHTGRRVGRLVVDVAPDGSLSGETWESKAMDRSIPDDPEMKALLEKYQK